MDEKTEEKRVPGALYSQEVMVHPLILDDRPMYEFTMTSRMQQCVERYGIPPEEVVFSDLNVMDMTAVMRKGEEHVSPEFRMPENLLYFVVHWIDTEHTPSTGTNASDTVL